jgi:hypothetical protein
MPLSDVPSLVQLLHEKGGETMKDIFLLLRFLFFLIFALSFLSAVLLTLMVVGKI